MAIKGKHALVLGGSMAGLLAAGVLKDHFERVTIIERDQFNNDAQCRKGVPQGAHVHGFWPRGLNFVDGLLPGLRDSLKAAGASHGDVAADLNWYQFDGLKKRQEVGIRVTLASRPFLEWQVRQRVLALPQIHTLQGASVQGLLADESRKRITGVAVQIDGAAPVPMEADLVVDATGRAGHATRWLQALGYDKPEESAVHIDLTYSSRLYERRVARDAIGSIVVATPPEGKRGGVAFAVEGGRWMVTLIGFMGERPPTDDEGFNDYARSLPLPAIHEIVSQERAISEATTFRFPANLRRHYEGLKRFPQGLIVTGDAMTCFNPAYGQGMTVAALEAEALQACLAESSAIDGLGRRFFRKVKPIIDVPWMITTGEDLRYPQATGARPPLLDTVNGYFTRVHRGATVDAAVCKAFFRVASFEAAPPTMFAPGTVWRAIRGARRFARETVAQSMP